MAASNSIYTGLTSGVRTIYVFGRSRICLRRAGDTALPNTNQNPNQENINGRSGCKA